MHASGDVRPQRAHRGDAQLARDSGAPQRTRSELLSRRSVCFGNIRVHHVLGRSLGSPATVDRDERVHYGRGTLAHCSPPRCAIGCSTGNGRQEDRTLRPVRSELDRIEPDRIDRA